MIEFAGDQVKYEQYQQTRRGVVAGLLLTQPAGRASEAKPESNGALVFADARRHVARSEMSCGSSLLID
jgi:hypothetical protein